MQKDVHEYPSGVVQLHDVWILHHGVPQDAHELLCVGFPCVYVPKDALDANRSSTDGLHYGLEMDDNR